MSGQSWKLEYDANVSDNWDLEYTLVWPLIVKEHRLWCQTAWNSILASLLASCWERKLFMLSFFIVKDDILYHFLLYYDNKIRLKYVKYLEHCLAHSKCMINVIYYYKCYHDYYYIWLWQGVLLWREKVEMASSQKRGFFKDREKKHEVWKVGLIRLGFCQENIQNKRWTRDEDCKSDLDWGIPKFG